MRNLKKTLFTLLLPSFLLLLFLLPSAASAETLSPWWHLAAAAQPTYIQPGTARQQEWRVTVAATGGHAGLEVGDYGLIEIAAGEPRDEVQASIEGELRADEQFPEHGPIVEVTAKAGPNNKFEVYEIKLAGELEYTHYFDLYPNKEYEELTGGPAKLTVEQVSEGRSDGVIVLTASNLGDAETSPTEPVTIADALPAGMEAVQIEGAVDETGPGNVGAARASIACSRSTVSCTFTPGERLSPLATEVFAVGPYEQIKVEISVNVAGAQTGAVNSASVVGGGAPSASVSQPLTLSDAPVPFGTTVLEMRPEEAGGALDAQAGSHPFQLTTTWVAATENGVGRLAGGQTKDLHFDLPVGLIGNPTPFTQCTLTQFLTNPGGNSGEQTDCPQASIVGVSRIEVRFGAGVEFAPEVTTLLQPVYNLEPGAGEPARFGFIVEGEPVELDTAVRTGGDYGVTVSVHNITQKIEFLSSETTFWGVPGAEAHNSTRGGGCLRYSGTVALGRHPSASEGCPGFSETHPPPLLTLPTSCPVASGGQGEPLQTTVEGDSWAEPTNPFAPLLNTAPMPALDGCNRLRFEPQIKVTPDGDEASKPTGLTVDVHVPQEGQLNPEGLAQSNVKNIAVTLPAGVTLNPSAADGLQACSEHLVGYEGSREYPTSPKGQSYPLFSPYLPGTIAAEAAGDTEPLTPGVNFCPNASKIAEVSIVSPLLPKGQPVKGFVYLGSPQNYSTLLGFPQENPFAKHVAMYIVAKDPISGTLVKLPGRAELGGEPGVEGLAPGQIRGIFEDNPQLAFEDAELHFFGGERAPLASPNACGAYTTSATFTPWDGGAPVSASSTFDITSGPNGSPCPGSSLPFGASLSSGTTSNNAGGFSPLSTTLSRPDGNQSIQSVTLHYPPGLSGLLSGVELCAEAQANAGTCGPNSQIGETIVSVGVGGDPFTVTGGKAYITGPYEGAPFGLSIVNPAKAGPFDLQEGRPVIVRAKIEVDPTTAALTITTNGPELPYHIPTIIEGFPLQIQHVNVLVNREHFTFNPTNCTPTKITGEIKSAEGASAAVEDPFQVTNCAALKFTPKFTVSTSGKTSKADGASLISKVTEPNEPQGSQANIAKVKVELPLQLPSRLTTLQKACTDAQFNANPAGCPSASKIGYAKVITPLLPVPLEGPAIFVSHGNESFPSLTIVLQGYGVTIDLVGTTFISKAGITSTTFKTVPDQPFNTFELVLPEGPYSALAANGNLCAPTTTKTIKKKVTVRVRGRKKIVTRKTKETVPGTLVMPNEFIAQNGAAIHEDTTISVTGCPKTVAHKAKDKKKRRKKGRKKG